MVKFFKDNIKYILQSIVVLLSVLLSFYIDSIRVNNQNAKYKNELVKDPNYKYPLSRETKTN